MSAPETHMTEMLATKAEARNLNFYYGDFRALKNITMPVHERKVTALIGPRAAASPPSCAASTACTTLPGQPLRGRDHAAPGQHQPARARRRSDRGAHADRHGVPEAQSLPKSVFENVAYGARARRVLAPAYRGEGRAGAAGRGAVGGGEGPAAPAGVQPFRRPAAAPVHRARARHRPGAPASTSRLRRSTRSPPPRSRS